MIPFTSPLLCRTDPLANPPPLPPSNLSQQPPTAPAGPVDRHTLFWLFFRFDGRVGRQVYWLSVLFLAALVGASGLFVVDPETGSVVLMPSPFASFIYTMASICSILVSIKRLHDLNMTGFFALGLIIPPVAVIMSLWLGIRKGDDGPNKFGWQRDVRPTQPPPTMPDDEDKE